MTASSRPESTGVFSSTVRALLMPRRAIPIAVVIVPLTIIQDAYSRDPLAVPLALAMSGSFLLVGPASFRALFPMDRPSPWAALRIVVYAALGAALVLGVGVVVPRVLGIGRTFLTSTPSLAVCVALFWVGGWGLARDIDLEARWHHERARSAALAKEAEHAQLLALKAHLDPHFLFNTLNAIAEWCREDGIVAEKAIVQLSSMLRTMMTGIEETSWPLSKELDLANALFALHAIRDPKAFAVKSEIDPNLAELDVPPMLLLPLAENAMKHGPQAGHRGDVVFRVSRTRDGSSVQIELSNPGAYGGPRDGGSGLSIVRKRLGLFFSGESSFAIEADGDRTKTTLVLPTRRDSA